jgi:hypothetical protein
MVKGLLLWVIAACTITSLIVTLQTDTLSFLCLVCELCVVMFFALRIYRKDETANGDGNGN